MSPGRTRTPLRLAALALGALASACGGAGGRGATDGDDPSGSIDTTIATTHADESPATPNADCLCVQGDHALLDSYDADACGWGPCGAIEFSVSDDGRPVLDLTALDCSLQALRDGTPALLSFHQSLDRGYSGSGGFLKIGAGRTALTRTWDWDDFSFHEEGLVVTALRDPAYFESCMAEPAADARFECMKDWAQGVPLKECDPAHWYPFGP